MERQEMIEKLHQSVEDILNGDGTPRRAWENIEEVIAALRTERAEPVAWLCVSEHGHRDAVADANARDVYAQTGRTITPLYTTPPPDHAEALAEAIDAEIVKLWKKLDKAEDLREQYIACWMAVHEIDDALTRYKESRNG